MFADNKYTRWYASLVARARGRTKVAGMETHHVVPRCLGGTDDADNLVHLTYREHYIAHALLTKMHNSPKLQNAFWQMCAKGKSKYYNSSLYAHARQSYAARISGDAHWAKTSHFRQQVSDSWTLERKASFAASVSGDAHWTRKRDMSEHAAKMRASMSSEDRAANLRRRHEMYGNPMQRPEIAAKFKKPKPKVQCPHCSKEGGKPVMMRYHFDNCKHR